MSVARLTYRPEIDGLRAIAVLTVVSYHAALGIPGGYVGVDVFFVISGFLIISLITNELSLGDFSAARFWERRARRIMPALIFTVSATLVAGWFLLLPADYANLGKSAAWQAPFAANIHFWRNTGYFGITAEKEPLLHTWSLALEEQFYLVVPLLLMAVFQVRWLRQRPALIAFFLAGSIVSLSAAVYGVSRFPSATFYLLPTRAWELLLGGLVAIVSLELIPRSDFLRNLLAAAGLAAILASSFMYSKSTPFPGLAALPPCLGTALFIWGSSPDHGNPAIRPPFSARILATRPVVFVGLVSYSFYLWHWPFLVFGSYWSLDPVSPGVRAALIAASFCAALLTWRWIESPFREKRIGKGRFRMFVMAGSGTLAVFGAGIAVSTRRGFPERYTSATLRYASASNDSSGIHEVTAGDLARDDLPILGEQNPKAPVTLLLWGDSHGMAAAPAFDRFLKERRLSGRQATASATAPVVVGYWKNEFTTPSTVRAFNGAVLDYIKRHRVPIVVLVGFWEYYTDARGSVPLDSALLATVRRLEQIGARPYLLLQVPRPPFNVPHALAMSSIFGRDLTDRLAAPTGWNGLRGNSSELLDSLRRAGCQLLDPRPRFLDQTGSHFIVAKNGFSLYRDDHHLSETGAELVLVPLLRASLGSGSL